MNWPTIIQRKSPSSGSRRLDRLVHAARETRSRADVLSADARDRILCAVQRETTPEPLPSLFTPTRRLFAVGALPVLMAGAFLFLMSRSQPTVTPSVESATRVAVAKQGDRVLFTIANGGKSHSVYRSDSPASFEPGSAVMVTDGAYSDSIHDGSDIVFYRID